LNDLLESTADTRNEDALGDSGVASGNRLRAAGRTARILIVDDDAGPRVLLEELLRARFEVSTARDGETALAGARAARPDLVLTALELPRLDGAELCRRLHELDPELPVIVMTAHSAMQSVLDSLRAGAADYLMKPIDCDAVVWCVERALERRAEKRAHEARLRSLNEQLVLSNVRAQEHADAEAQQRLQLSTLLENLDEGIAVAEASGRILMLNPAARVVLGLAEREVASLIAEPLNACTLDGQRLLEEQRPLVRAARGEQFTDYEVLYLFPEGERRHVVFTGTAVKDQTGRVTLAIVVFRDVTAFRRLERQRDEYLALVSHDLRNPLHTVLMAVARLKVNLQKRGQAADVTTAERAERNAHRMTAMLEELFDATSLQSHGVELKRTACDLRALLGHVSADLDDSGSRRITIESDDASSYVVFADAAQIERVIVNLLTNALKYSPAGAPITATLERHGDTVRLAVVDRGIGIAPENVKRLFDRYYRAPRGKVHALGLGLGLYIARMIAEGHGGSIDAQSEVGKGSTFRFELPAHADSAREGGSH
jgi:PAS domain S-box-containing protein